MQKKTNAYISVPKKCCSWAFKMRFFLPLYKNMETPQQKMMSKCSFSKFLSIRIAQLLLSGIGRKLTFDKNWLMNGTLYRNISIRVVRGVFGYLFEVFGLFWPFLDFFFPPQKGGGPHSRWFPIYGPPKKLSKYFLFFNFEVAGLQPIHRRSVCRIVWENRSPPYGQ